MIAKTRGTIILLALLVVGESELSTAALIKFYGDISHNGEFWQRHAGPQDGCINLPQEGNDHLSSIHTDNECVILYEHNDCRGRNLLLYPGMMGHDDLVSHDFNDVTTSFRVCQHSKPQFSLFDDINHVKHLLDIRGIRQCIDLHINANDKISSVVTHGNCIRLYEHAGCVGKMVQLEAGMSSNNLIDYDINDRVSSINVCSP